MNANAKSGLAEYQRKIESGEIERAAHKNQFEKLAENPTSLRSAINAHCYDCGGADSDTNWRARVKYCQIITCPLHKVRPYSKGITDDECLTWEETT